MSQLTLRLSAKQLQIERLDKQAVCDHTHTHTGTLPCKISISRECEGQREREEKWINLLFVLLLLLLLKYASLCLSRRRRASTADSAAISVTKLAKWWRHMWQQQWQQRRQHQQVYCCLRMQRPKRKRQSQSANVTHTLALSRYPSLLIATCKSHWETSFFYSRCPFVCDGDGNGDSDSDQNIWHSNKLWLSRQVLLQSCSLQPRTFWLHLIVRVAKCASCELPTASCELP